MKVKAKPGTRCPMEEDHRKYITDSEAVDVPGSTYYKRLVRDGSLVLADPDKGKKEVKSDGK